MFQKHMLTAEEERVLLAELSFGPDDRWLELLYRCSFQHWVRHKHDSGAAGLAVPHFPCGTSRHFLPQLLRLKGDLSKLWQMATKTPLQPSVKVPHCRSCGYSREDACSEPRLRPVIVRTFWCAGSRAWCETVSHGCRRTAAKKYGQHDTIEQHLQEREAPFSAEAASAPDSPPAAGMPATPVQPTGVHHLVACLLGTVQVLVLCTCRCLRCVSE